MREKQPTLFMIVGLPGAGKTTKAKEIGSEYSALRLSGDDWILTLYGNDLDRPQRDAIRNPIEALQWQVVKRVLQLGCNVVLDWGFWSKEERSKYRKEAEELGAKVKLIYLEVPTDQLWARISKRPESRKGTLAISRKELEEWSTRFEPPDEEELL